jgi:hypothetical protein
VAAGATCGGCGAFLAPGAAICERCGWRARADDASPDDMFGRLAEMSWHGLWKWLWVVWTIAYPIISVGDLLGTQGQPVAQFGILVVAGFSVWPWLVGVIVLGVLYTVTKE